MPSPLSDAIFSIPTLGAGGGGEVALSLLVIILFGVGAQWLAWRLKIPSILLLLLAGIAVGPVARTLGSPVTLDPNELLGGDLLLSLVGVAVGLILYEGGLTLRFKEIRSSASTVALLVSVGMLGTWVVCGLAAFFIAGLPAQISVLLGAILVVTGPTVIGPMLGHIRPSGRTGPILKWEGIVIDPIGVLLAVLVFEVVRTSSAGEAAAGVAWAIGRTLVAGGGLGFVAAHVLLFAIRRYLIPDQLQNSISLMLVVVTFITANLIQAEAGLLATTVMGVTLANQSVASVRHIIEFKENLRVLFIGALFIVLAARLELEDLRSLDLGIVIGFIVVVILVARPVCVLLSTIGGGLKWNEKMFLCAVAPRGIVAAAGASIFAIELEGLPEQIEGAEALVPMTFATIIATVAIYGLSASPIARVLGVSDQNPQGLLIIGAVPWVRRLAKRLDELGIRVLIVDTNRANVRAAMMEGLTAKQTNVLTEGGVEDLDLEGIGRVMALTPNDEVNTLALQRLSERFDSAGLYYLPARTLAKPSAKPDKTSGSEQQRTEHGRPLFSSEADFQSMASRIANGWIVKATTLSEEFGWKDYRTLYSSSAIPLFVRSASGAIQVVTALRAPAPGAGDTIISLVNPDELLMPVFTPEADEDDEAPPKGLSQERAPTS